MTIRDSKTGRIMEYHISSPVNERHYILRLLIHKNTGLSVFRRLIAMRTLMKNRASTDTLRRLTEDADFVKQNAGREWSFPL